MIRYPWICRETKVNIFTLSLLGVEPLCRQIKENPEPIKTRQRLFLLLLLLHLLQTLHASLPDEKGLKEMSNRKLITGQRSLCFPLHFRSIIMQNTSGSGWRRSDNQRKTANEQQMNSKWTSSPDKRKWGNKLSFYPFFCCLSSWAESGDVISSAKPADGTRAADRRREVGKPARQTGAGK